MTAEQVIQIKSAELALQQKMATVMDAVGDLTSEISQDIVAFKAIEGSGDPYDFVMEIIETTLKLPAWFPSFLIKYVVEKYLENKVVTPLTPITPNTSVTPVTSVSKVEPKA